MAPAPPPPAPLLEAGFDMPAMPRRKVADIPNLPQGAIVPVDMTATVCRSKPVVTLQDGAELAGWAASFGTYDSPDKAQMALRGRALSPAGLTAGGRAGVIELPDNSGYSPVIWGLDQTRSATVCAQYKQDGAHCDVLPAVMMDKIALVAKAKKAAQAAQSSIEQGADSDQKPVRRIGIDAIMLKPAHVSGVLLALAAASIYGAVPNFAPHGLPQRRARP